ncbi:MAG: prepilin-type N-terminal cleavage/methylation domain-containing protein [Elusimicrobia bacterium]|nr:prepilin-type N-terminal cleavage/methylation domain-containing protein [Elusimicrobiota bacterium]
MKRGFSLLELLIATALALLVMVAIMSVSSMMVKRHLEAIHKGEVNAATLLTLNAVQRDVADSTYLFVPTSASPLGDVVGGCTNWSPQMVGPNTGGKLDAGQPVTYFLYCIDGFGARFSTLYRYGGTIPDCQSGVTLPAGCGAGPDSQGRNPVAWVSGNGADYGLSRSDQASGYYFAWSRDSGGVEIHYILGNSTPTADTANRPGHAVPHYYKIDTKVKMIKSFNVTL